MEKVWIPVNPVLDPKTGEFLTLKNFKGKERFIPNPLKGADPGKSQVGEEKKFSFSLSSNFEIASIGGINSNFGSTTFIHDSLVYRKSRAPIVGGSSLISGTWWGFGIRLKIIVKSSQFGVNINWSGLAASVQLGYAEAEFEIESIGLADAEIFEMLPNPTDLNIESLNIILDAGNLIRERYSKIDPDNVVYRPFRIEVPKSELTKVDPIHDDRHLIFVYRQISNRQKLGDAKSQAIDIDLDPNLVAKYYKEQFGISSETYKPSRNHKKLANDWLNV